MSGLGLILSIARDALAAQRYALDVTAHNIANVNTPGYSRQRPVHEARQTASYRGLQLGRGVDIDQVLRSTDQFIENRLMQEKSRMLSSSEMENYIKVFEGLFNETSETSISTMLSDFWNLWHDISNNPSGASERIALYEYSSLLSEQFNTLDGDLRQLETELTNTVSAGIDKINQITNEIAQLNDQIIGMETSNNTANDLRDTRNTLVSELSEYIDVMTFEQGNGSLTVFAARGCILVHENSSYDLELGGDNGDRVEWQGSGNTTVDITDYTTKGKLDGWLDMRDEVIAKYKLDLDELAKEFIWAVNQQHSQGVGLKLFSTEVTGTYKTDSSGLLSTLTYGNKIDYTKDFKMWIEDSSVTPGTFSAVAVDMGISTAAVSNWAGLASDPVDSPYKFLFTVTTGGAVGTDVNVTEANGAGLGEGQTAGTVSDALDKAIAEQTITVTGGSYGTQIVNVANSGGDATRSAKDIADALNDLNGVKAYASDNSAIIDITGVTNVADGDGVSFTLDVEGVRSTQTFTVSVATLQNQFETAISAAVTAINSANSDTDLAVNGLTITSASGKNIGIEDFDTVNGNDLDTITFAGATVTETGGAGDDSAVVTGTVTIFLDPGLSIQSDVAGTGTDGGLFNVAADTDVTLGNSIITLGGQGGFTDFTDTNEITFYVDGNEVNYTVSVIDDTDIERADELETALSGAGLDSTTYSISRNGASVSILKTDGTAIEITGFDETGDDNATLAVSTGTGTGTTPPANALLDAADPGKTSATSTRLFGSEGVTQGYSPVISWEKLDASGAPTGSSGSINVAYPETVVVEGTLSFDIGAGALVAGNTFTINTDSTGVVDPFSFTPSEKANSILDTYKFTVTSGGEIGTDTVDIKWSNSITSGTFTLEGAAPSTVEVDGMTIQFTDGTLFNDDVFTITTDDQGSPTRNLPSDWHWTFDSFTDQFNRQTSYVTASKTADNALKFDATASDNELKNYSYSGLDGFFGSNITITVNNYEALNRTGTDFQLERDDVAYAATGDWGVPAATNPGYAVTLTALDGSDLDNGFYVELDGVRALTVTFDTPITDNGYVEFDIATASGDYSFGFSDDEAEDSGLMAALGINTVFEGGGAGSIGINSQIANKDYIAAAQIDGDTGNFAAGDNTNALAIADLQYNSQNIALWTSSRGSAKSSANVTATLEDYYHSTVGSIGTRSASISRSKAFSEVMVNKLVEIRDSISAVSLDEEMTNLIKFQHAYAAAAKLISVSDEMFNTLLSVR